jgi:hypothetical protein
LKKWHYAFLLFLTVVDMTVVVVFLLLACSPFLV